MRTNKVRNYSVSKKRLKGYLKILIFLPVLFLLTDCITYTKQIKAPNGISEMKSIPIGGIDQWVMYRGYDVTNPIILFLHGGPGASETAFLRKHNRVLEEHFTMVYWDQRGAAKSYDKNIPQETMTITQFLSDLEELIEHVREKFGKEKVILMGHSWGTVLGLLTVKNNPELVDAYIGIGQVVNSKKGEEISYNYTLDKALELEDKKAIAELNELGRPVNGEYKDPEGIWKQRKWLRKFGGERYGKKGIFDLILQIWFSTEYNFFDVIDYTKSGGFAYRLRNEEKEIDFFTQIKEVSVPCFFISGKYDYNTPKELVKEYSEKLTGPEIRYYEFEQSAHSPIFEEADRFNELIIALFAELRTD